MAGRPEWLLRSNYAAVGLNVALSSGGAITATPHVRLHQLFAHTRFTLLVILDQVEGEQLEAATRIFEALERDYPGVIRVELIAPETPYPWPGLLPTEDSQARVANELNAAVGGELILVRPDVYIGCRTGLASFTVMDQFLQSILIKA